MNYSLGLIGHPIMNISIKKIIEKNFDKITVHSIPVVDENDIERALSKIKILKCDGLLFISENTHHLFSSKFNIDIPSVYLKKTKLEVCRSLFHLCYVHNHNLNSISIDTLSYDTMSDIYQFLGIGNFNECKINTIPIAFGKFNLVDGVLQKHIENHNKYNCVCITYFTEVDKRLKAMHIPSILVMPTNEMIIDKLNQLKALDFSADAKTSKQVILLITLSSLNEHIILENSAHSIMTEYNRITEAIFWFSEKLSGTYIGEDRKKYYIFCDSRDFERETNFFSKHDILNAVAQKSLVHASIGIGYGKNHNYAMKNAVIANIRAKKENKNAAFIVHNDNKIFGPLYSSNQNSSCRNEIYDLKLKKIASESSLSINTIYKLNGVVKQQQKDVLTSSEIAAELNITQRSANRIITKLLKSRFVELAGNKSNGAKGRPIRLYKLNF